MEHTQPLEQAQADAKVSRETFCVLVSECEGTLYNVAVAILGNRADCLDAMQDAVLAAWRSLGSLREPRYFKTWLTRILINQCRRTLRRRHGLPAQLNDTPDAWASSIQGVRPALSAPKPDDESAALRAAVDALPDRLRPVIVLHCYEDFAVEDVARMLGIPQGTVKSRLSRGRDLLRRAMQ